MSEASDHLDTPEPEAPAAAVSAPPVPAHAADVFDAIADRLEQRCPDLGLFAETRASYKEWCVWEALAGLRTAWPAWTITPRPRYADVGVTGSRDSADLLVFDPARGSRVLMEIGLVNEWSRNAWIDMLDGGTERLRRVTGVHTMQIVIAASLTSAIDVNHTWQQWLGLSRIWTVPTGLDRVCTLGSVGQLAVRGWVTSG